MDLLLRPSRFCFEREEKGEDGCARMITGFFIKAIGAMADSSGAGITLRNQLT
jgi:hypothetical protein